MIIFFAGLATISENNYIYRSGERKVVDPSIACAK